MKNVLIIIAVLVVVGIGGCIGVTNLFVGAVKDGIEQWSAEHDEQIAQLASGEAQVSELSKTGELADFFNADSEMTQLARDVKGDEIFGKVIEWTSTVGDLERITENVIRVRTKASEASLNGDTPKEVQPWVTIYPQSETETQYLIGLKEGDSITYRGYITRGLLVDVSIDPAIVIIGPQQKAKSPEIQPSSGQ